MRKTLADGEAVPIYDMIPLDERLNRGLANDRLLGVRAGRPQALARM